MQCDVSVSVAGPGAWSGESGSLHGVGATGAAGRRVRGGGCLEALASHPPDLAPASEQPPELALEEALREVWLWDGLSGGSRPGSCLRE